MSSGGPGFPSSTPPEGLPVCAIVASVACDGVRPRPRGGDGGGEGPPPTSEDVMTIAKWGDAF